jgi:hypothetical protein
MKSRSVVRCLLWILFSQYFGGCVGTLKDASLDVALTKLDARMAQILVDPMGSSPGEREVAAACVLDYYRKYGQLTTLNQPANVEHLAQRKSTVVKYRVVALMLRGLSKCNPNPSDLFYWRVLDEYSRATVDGREQAKRCLTKYGMWVQL